MNYILTLICNPSTAIINNTAQAIAIDSLKELGAETKKTQWLAPGIACEIPFCNLDLETAKTTLQHNFQGLQIDVIVQTCANRRKKFLIADMDSTMVIGETLDDLAELAGLKDEVATITNMAMNGELQFVEALKKRVKLLEGLSLDDLERTMSKIKLMPGGKTLVQTMKANGAVAILVSGGFTYFTDRVRDLIGFDEAKGNKLEISNSKLTGEVLDPIIDNSAKLSILRKFAKKLISCFN